VLPISILHEEKCLHYPSGGAYLAMGATFSPQQYNQEIRKLWVRQVGRENGDP
jgi:hypothetical protein